jgi:hypothetical protein
MYAAWYNDTLKFNKKFKLRVAGHTKVRRVHLFIVLHV